MTQSQEGEARMRAHVGRFVLVAFLLCWFATPSFATSYDWVEWTYPTSTTAHAAVGALGSIDVSVNGLQGHATPLQFRFDAPAPLPTDPTLDEALSVGHGGGNFDVWSFDVQFSPGFDTTGLVLGVGNFAHGLPSYPGYQLTAFETDGDPMALSGFAQIGGHLSYDHTWITQPGAFNDDVYLDVTGKFIVTTVSGRNDSNSDILLLSLPGGVGRLNISALPTDPGNPAGGDTINIVVAIPEPSTLTLAALGLALLGRRRRSHRAVR